MIYMLWDLDQTRANIYPYIPWLNLPVKMSAFVNARVWRDCQNGVTNRASSLSSCEKICEKYILYTHMRDLQKCVFARAIKVVFSIIPKTHLMYGVGGWLVVVTMLYCDYSHTNSYTRFWLISLLFLLFLVVTHFLSRNHYLPPAHSRAYHPQC